MVAEWSKAVAMADSSVFSPSTSQRSSQSRGPGAAVLLEAELLQTVFQNTTWVADARVPKAPANAHEEPRRRPSTSAHRACQESASVSSARSFGQEALHAPKGASTARPRTYRPTEEACPSMQ